MSRTWQHFNPILLPQIRSHKKIWQDFDPNSHYFESELDLTMSSAFFNIRQKIHVMIWSTLESERRNPGYWSNSTEFRKWVDPIMLYFKLKEVVHRSNLHQRENSRYFDPMQERWKEAKKERMEERKAHRLMQNRKLNYRQKEDDEESKI